jgi:hypothetical protein
MAGTDYVDSCSPGGASGVVIVLPDVGVTTGVLRTTGPNRRPRRG